MSENTIRRSLRDGRAGTIDWSKFDQKSDSEIEMDVASDPDAAPLLDANWFENAEEITPNKQMISIRLDREVLDFFRASGRNYQSRMNAVLKSYMQAKKKAG